MQPTLGVGLVTCNRRGLLVETLERVRTLTLHPNAYLVVADDGSTDGTVEMLREHNAGVVTGANMGVAWNKNRALYLLNQVLRCDVTILLEDDTEPVAPGWETPWIDAALRHGQINFAAPWMQPHFLAGNGTPEDPVRSMMVTAQCSAFARAALDWGGYFDSRFRGFGHEHVEHSARLIRHGFGGEQTTLEGRERSLFLLLRAPLRLKDSVSFSDPEQVERNLVVAQVAMQEHFHRMPWRNEDEARQFRAEIEAAIAARPQGFGMSPTASLDHAPLWLRHALGR